MIINNNSTILSVLKNCQIWRSDGEAYALFWGQRIAIAALFKLKSYICRHSMFRCSMTVRAATQKLYRSSNNSVESQPSRIAVAALVTQLS